MRDEAEKPAIRYDNFTIALHWITVLLVVTLFLLAQFWGYFARPDRHVMIAGHMSLGILLAAVLVIRMIWRSMPRHQIPPATSGLDELASKTVQTILYILLAAQVILGFALRWTSNHPLSFFGLLIPSPFGHFPKSTSHLVARIHGLNAWAIMVIAGGHAAAALFHQFVRGDKVLPRMLPGAEKLPSLNQQPAEPPRD